MAFPDTLYSISDPPFTSGLRSLLASNQEHCAGRWPQLVAAIENILDGQYVLLSHHWVPITQVLPFHPHLPATLSILHKGNLALFAALELTRSGLHGPARPLFRQTFEGQIIAKYVSLAPSSVAARNWDAGETVALTNDILNKIRRPDLAPVRTFWKLLCQYTHSSGYSQQVSPAASYNDQDIYHNFVFLSVLCEIQFHLVTTIALLPSARRFVKRYDRKGVAEAARSSIRAAIKQVRSEYGPESRALTFSVTRRWQLR